MINHFSAKQTQYDEFEKVSEEVEARSSKGFFGWIIGAIISIVVGLISKSVFFYIAAAAFVAAFVLFKILNKKKLEAATTLQNKLLRELQDHFDAYGYCSVGFEYTKPSTLETLYEYVRTGRVNTLGDAINEYMKDIHNQRIEDMQKDILETEREIAKNTKKAAKYSRKAAIYSGASFFFK